MQGGMISLRNPVFVHARARAAIGLGCVLASGAAWAGTPVVPPAKPSGHVAVVAPPPLPPGMVQVAFPFAQPAMRVARENPSARNPPPLPQIVTVPNPDDATLPDATPAPAAQASPSPVPDATSVTVKIENPLLEAIDFFRGAAVRADRDTLTGTMFDPTFRPALPPQQPVSSATYQETP